jgi:uncharacterized membrane protein
VVFIVAKVAHIVAVVIGFGPLFVYPMIMRRTGGDADLLRALRFVRSRVSEPAFIAVGPLGLLAASQHPDVEVFSRLWVHLAIPLWLFAVSVVWFVQRPLSKKVVAFAIAVSTGDSTRDAELRQRMNWLTRVTWISWAGLVGMLLLMVTRPA